MEWRDQDRYNYSTHCSLKKQRRHSSGRLSNTMTPERHWAPFLYLQLAEHYHNVRRSPRPAHLENGRDDLPDVGGELVLEHHRHVDEHHDVAVLDVRRDVGPRGRGDDVCGYNITRKVSTTLQQTHGDEGGTSGQPLPNETTHFAKT